MSYLVNAEWDDAGWWVATVPDVPGAITQSCRLDQVLADAAEVIEIQTGQPVAPEGVDVMMPRTVQEILDHADDLARRFEDYEPDPSDRRDPAVLAAVRDAVIARSEAERTLTTVVRAARGKGHSWQSIGTLLGTSGEAAHQRYGKPAKDTRQSA